jgi:ATP-binding cassette subfamily F protein 3
MGEHPLQGGELRLGASVDAGYYRQDLSQVPLDRTIYEVIEELRPQWERRLVQGHLGRFGFSGDEVQRRAGTLSGGERSRVALAMLMLSGANLLILDEPTNHLDVESIEALEDAIDRYDGSILLVSHDRELLRALTTKVWVLYDRHVTEFDGGFAEWEEVSAEREHAAAVRAAEEGALRRVAAKRGASSARAATNTGGRGKNVVRSRARSLQRELEEAEARVTSLEEKVTALSRELSDPELYVNAEGIHRAAQLGSDLESAKAELDKALEVWSRASEAVTGP